MTDLSKALNAPDATGVANGSADGILNRSTLSGEVLRWNPPTGSFLAL